MLRGVVISEYPEYNINLENLFKRFIGKKIIAKFINGNRLLPWISKRFKTKAIFIIIRHPCATIYSQIKSGWIGYPKELQNEFRRGNKNLLRRIILEEASLIPQIKNNSKLIRKIKKLDTIVELLAVEWSLDYYIPLSNWKNYIYNLVVYERLLTSGSKLLQDIYNKTGYPLNFNGYKLLKVPSIMSKEKEINFQKQLLKWKNNLSQEKIERILEVLKWFDFDFYGENPEPDYDALKSYDYLGKKKQKINCVERSI